MTERRSIDSVIAEHGGMDGMYRMANAMFCQSELLEEGYEPTDEVETMATGSMIHALQRLHRQCLKAGHPEQAVVIHRMVGTLLPRFRAGLDRWKAENPE